MTSEEKEAYERELENAADQIDAAFLGEYKAQISGLYALSQAEVDALAPGTADLQTYAKLIAVVEKASAQNLAQPDLVNQIRALGSLGVRIARLVPSLRTFLV